MPHCTLWTETEWLYARRTAELWNVWDTTHDTKVLAEVRQREKVLGTTVDARRDLRIRYVTAEPVQLAPVQPIDRTKIFDED